MKLKSENGHMKRKKHQKGKWGCRLSHSPWIQAKAAYVLLSEGVCSRDIAHSNRDVRHVGRKNSVGIGGNTSKCTHHQVSLPDFAGNFLM